MSDDIEMWREWAMPNKWTFKVKPIRKLLEDEISEDELWIDPLAGKEGHKFADVTNDLNPDIETDFTMEATDFLQLFDDKSVDGIIYDPPYSGEQIKRSYENIGHKPDGNYTQSSYWGEHRDEISRVMKIGGKVISFGWWSTGIGKTRGFEKRKIMLVCHGSAHPDTICVVEEKVNEVE